MVALLHPSGDTLKFLPLPGPDVCDNQAPNNSPCCFGLLCAHTLQVCCHCVIIAVACHPLHPSGPVVLDGLRVNQLQLCRQLSGDVSLTQPRLLLRGRGTGRSGDELLELDLALPTAPAHAAGPGPDGLVPSNLYYPPGFAPAARQQLISTSLNSSGPSVRSSTDVAGNQAEVGEGGGGDGGDEWPDQQPSWAAECGGVVDSSTSPAVTAEAQRVSHVLLRRGDLHFSSTVRLLVLCGRVCSS